MEKLDLRLCTPESLTFCTFSSEEIKRLSVAKIITPLSFNAVGHPLTGGLYDPALGPFGSNGMCATCNMKMYQCPGHFGCIELPLVVVNPLYHKVIVNIFKISCLNCHTILLPTITKYVLANQIKLLDKGFFIEASELSSKYSRLMATFWENVKFNKIDIGLELSLIAELEQEVKNILQNVTLTHIEIRGESDLRKKFLDSALAYLYKGKICPRCNTDFPKIQVLRNKIIINDSKVKIAKKFNNATENSPKSSGSLKSLTPKDCQSHLNKIFQNDGETLKAMIPMLVITSEASPIDSLFMKYILVSPTNTRPCNFRDGMITEHPQNSVYKAILNDCLILRSIILLMNGGEGKEELAAERKEVVEKLRGNDYSEKLLFAWYGLQENVDTLLDIETKKGKFGMSTSGIGLKQIIEKKQGILRMNMMGKRVNFAARTVITPDPNLSIDEIGIPEEFAKRLTYPVVVTVWNVEELRKLVINGPDVHPGANVIVDEMKKIIKIDKYDAVQRESIAKRLLTPGDKPGYKIVHRHLINGDILLLNRQPTLHRPSIMAHKARILKGEKTFRLHYANCKSYNADFDGDEMNAHFPQNEVARSEGYNLVSVNKQYLVPKDGTPLSGLIQDHVVSGVKLSIRGKMFTKGQYMQLVFQALSSFQGDVLTLKPCFLKPVELWSGKQVISTVLLNVIPKGKVPINLTSEAKISQKAWIKGPSRHWVAGGTPFKNDIVMSEAEVVIRGGELLSGVLDKTHYGATPYSLVHCLYELYGGDVSSAFLSALAKLFTAFLQMEGFTLGVEDILVLKDADKKRKKIIHKVRNIGDEIVSDLLNVPEGSSLKEEIAHMYARDPMFRAVLDHKYKTSLDDYTNNINKACIPKGLLSPFPDNNLQLMVQSGAKGSTVNTMQISCLLGQIELEGKRPPLMISGKSLPSFPYFDTSPRAGGFVDGRFMTGIKPQEFFFHCMAGREGLIDTAVKTSRSGYLQRCLVKHLEGLNVNYDMTVRDSDGSVIQFLYGEDGLEVTKCQFLKENQMPFLVDNMHAIHDEEIVNSIKEHSELNAIKAYNKIIKKWRKQNVLGKIRRSGFSIFTEEMKYSIDKNDEIIKGVGRSSVTMELCKLWRKLSTEEKAEYERRCLKTPDTLVSRFQPDRNYGALTEKMDQLISNYYEQRKGDFKEKTIRNIINEKVLTAVCPPGEPVGLLAAQSVGEPSTQMTLNTFHFAGRGEMNVTLGIPRLREILMVASKNIKTPSMVIYFKDAPNLDHIVNKIRKKMTRISLADVLEKIHVHEEINIRSVKKVYSITMQFLPHEAYKDNTSVTPKQILKYVERRFMKTLINKLLSFNKKSETKDLIIVEDATERTKGANNSDDEGEEKAEKKVPKQKNVGIGDDYQSSEDEPEGDDDDATTAKRRTKHQEEHQYSDVEDDASVQEEVGEGGEEDDVWEAAEDKKEEETEEEADRKANVISGNAITDYMYDTLKEEWCKLVFEMNVNFMKNHVDISSILKELCHNSIVHEVPGIRKAYIQSDFKTGKPILRTDGINFSEIFQKDRIIDVNKLYSNDIHAMASIYGIEAASSIIVKEVQDVFKGYGITVDTRHLNLVASYMTFSGVYRPLSRKGMEGGASPLQQMSFESSLGFLKMAVTRKKTDDLCSPSSRLMMGTPVKTGTGSFRLLQKILS